MNVFHCDHCQQLVFFENIHCVACNHTLAYLPDLAVIGSLEQEADGLWRLPQRRFADHAYRLCENFSRENVCNWAIPAGDAEPLCASCRLTRVIPDLTQPGYKEAWYKLEVAKRRLVYTLIRLGLPIVDRKADPVFGLAFEFVADPTPPTPDPTPLLTGHAKGVITINIAEADDAEREKRRVALYEPYRTLLGHMRHEIGHYYWDRWSKNQLWLERFRKVFGDEREDYGEALKRHYEKGPAADWQTQFVTSYASSHPWEDWAETHAHYLHMVDTLETTAACGLSLRPRRNDKPTLKQPGRADTKQSFDQMIENWFPLTYVINNLNRGLGLPDGYPFILPPAAIQKLRFVHDAITG